MNTLKLKQLSTSMLIAISMGATPVIAEPTFEVSGAVEIEMNTGEAYDSTIKSSDITLATVELGFDAKINDNVSAHILMLHEDDSTESPVIDEGVITISSGIDPSASPGHHRPGTPKRDTSSDSDMYFYLSAGRMYIPFGNFESHMISDPLTLELGETQEAAIQIGFAIDGFHASVYAFNGEADKNKVDNDVVDDFGISISYSLKTGSVNLNLGVDYLNNMAETDFIQGVISQVNIIEEHTAGMALHAIINIDALTVIFEHVTALDDFNTLDLQFNTGKANPSASNIEVAYTMDIAGREMTLAVAHQSSSDIDGRALPETRHMISVSTTIADDVGFTVEYTNSNDYEISDGGSGESGGVLTAQLVVEF